VRTVALAAGLSVVFAVAANAAPPVPDLSATYAPSGRAPLLVYFDASGTTDTDTSKPIHHLTYCFDAGDGNPDAYTLSGHKPVPKAQFCGGPQFAYVYQQPGSYEASVTAFDQTGNASTRTLTIRVDAYAGSETVCVADDTAPSFFGCPSGAVRKTEGDVGFEDYDNALDTAFFNPVCAGAPCKRLLFQGGGTFRIDSQPQSVGGVAIGAYGNGRFTLSGSLRKFEGVVAAQDDLRLERLVFDGGGNAHLAKLQAGAADSDHFLARDLVLSNMSSLVTVSDAAQNGGARPQNWGFFEIDASGGCGGGNTGDNCFFVHAERLSLVGNHLARSGEHIARLTHYNRAFIMGNRLERPSNERKSLLTMRGDDFSGDNCRNGWSGLWAELGQVSDNHFVCESARCTNFGAGNGCDGGADPHVRDNIFERNYFTVASGKDAVAIIQLVAEDGGANEDATIRNNIFNLADGGSGNGVTSGWGPGFESYNNAVYNDGTIWYHKGDSSTGVAKNNVGWTPRGSSLMFELEQPGSQSANWDNDGAGAGADNGVADLPSCPFVACPPRELTDFRLNDSIRQIIGPGDAVPNLTDHGQNRRTAWDVGAWEGNSTPLVDAMDPPALSAPFLRE